MADGGLAVHPPPGVGDSTRYVVEDNAHGLFGTYRGRWLGTFGRLATQSFHESKNFSCGEGGALILNDPALAERAEVVREKGTDRTRFFRGQVDKYTWVDLGSSYLPSELVAAVLCAQLEAWQTIQARRRALRPSGHLLFVDAVWAPRRVAGRLLWRYDRGAFPRTPEALQAMLALGFDPVREQRYAYLHDYLIWVGAPRGDGNGT